MRILSCQRKKLRADCSLNVIKIFPESAIKFWSYEYSKRWFARNVDGCAVADISGSSRFVAGGIGGVTSQLRESELQRALQLLNKCYCSHIPARDMVSNN